MPRWIPLTAPEPGLEDAPQPIIDIHVFGPKGSEDVKAVVDTGSSYSVFPRGFLERVGVDFTNAQSIPAVVGSGETTYLVGDESLVECQYDGHLALVRAHASEGAKVVMLGVNDFLCTFDLTVQKRKSRFRLIPRNRRAVRRLRRRTEQRP